MEEQSTHDQPTVVVLEDEPDIAEMIQEALREAGYDVQCADHLAKITGVDERNAPDLMLIDLVLPELPGAFVARQLRDHGFAHTPMIAMSADSVTLLFARRSGLFQAALPKPFDVSTLVEYVEEYAGTYVTG